LVQPFQESIMVFRTAASAAALIVCAASAQAQTTLIRDVRVFDGARALERTNVLVRDGLIAAVGSSVNAPPGAAVVDGAGHTLLPGLIDAHAHAFGDALAEALVFGVTTELDMFTDHNVLRAWQAEQREGKATQRADIFSAGTLVTAPGGHGTQFGMSIPTITGVDSAQAFVDARIAEGSSWIKIVYDDGHMYDLSWATVTPQIMKAVIVAAHRRHKLAVVHVSTLAAAREAIEAGADGLVHLFTDVAPTQEFIALAKARGVFIVPTLVVLKSIAGTPGGAPLLDDAQLTPYITPLMRTMLQSSFPVGRTTRTYDFARSTVTQLHAAGVRVLAGSDAPNPGTAHGIALLRELELLVEAGMTPAQALTAATSLPATAFGLPDRGRIAPGLRASLVLVAGDPTQDIRALRNVVAIWKDGVRLDRAAVRARVAEQVAAANAPPPKFTARTIADFEHGSTASAFGTVWLPNTDSYAGGKSTVVAEIVNGGANGSRHSLQLSGTISDAVSYAWAGAMWSPGAQPMSPADLSATSGVAFQAKGDGGAYRVLVFAQSRGYEPLSFTFKSTTEWAEVSVPWSAFGVDGRDIMAVMIVGGPQAGAFNIQVDNVRLH
jgi:imidazolonepropionase-like amidohydrolase